jgi:hypothetical protein
MANTLATPSWVTKEVARGFLNDITFVSNLNRTYDDQYIQSGAKVGNTVNARLPQRFTVTDGQALQLQNITESTVPITLTNQKNVAFGYSSAQATTELDNIRERYVTPASNALANAADVLAYQAVYKDVYNLVGVPGTTPATNLLYLNAGVKLTDGAVSLKGRKAVLDPAAMAALVNANTAIFNPSGSISEQYTTGQFGRKALGYEEWYQDPNRPAHVTGSFASCSPTVNGANQTGASVVTANWTTLSLKKGDIVTFAGCNSVNPESYQSTGRLQQFTLTADVTDSGGAATLSISPSIVTSGAYQTVDASPTSGGAVTAYSTAAATALTSVTSPQSMVFTKDAFAFVMADLIKPGAGADAQTVRSKEFGIAIRMVEQYQIATDQNPSRLDILIGAATVQARFAARVAG